MNCTFTFIYRMTVRQAALAGRYAFLLVLLFAFYSPIYGQVIATESFETAMIAGSGQGDCGCITLPDQFSDGFNDYYGRQSDGTIAANGGADYSNEDGGFYLAGEDHDAGGDCTVCTGTLCMTMDNLVVPNPTQDRTYQVSFLAGGNNANSDWEIDDFLRIEYSTDDQSTWNNLVCFTYTTTGSLETLTEDSDCVQPGDNINTLAPALTAYAGTFNAQNPTNNRIHVRVCANSNSGNEEWAVDLIEVQDMGANSSIVCPTVGAVANSSSAVCENDLFDVTATGLANMDMAANMEQDFGIRFVAFTSTPVDPYVGGTDLGTVTFGALTAGNTTAALVGASLATAGTYTVYAVLSPTPTASSCRPSAVSSTLTVSAPSNVTFTAPADVCEGDAAFVTSNAGLPSGAGGVYSGTGVTDVGDGVNFIFTPATAGVGTFTLTYTFTNGAGCVASASDDIQVFADPVVSFTAPADLCINAGVQTGLGGGTPTGGVYSGTGVTDDGNGMTYSFDPAAAGVGTHTITYTFTSNGCTGSASDDIEVFAVPNVTFTALADLCINAGVQSGLGGGTPTGGVYSGTGVTDDGNGMTYSFDPAAAGVGTHTITYNLTDSNGCMDSASDDVEVFALPNVTFTAPADVCEDDAPFVTSNAGLPSGAGGVYSGPGVSDSGDGVNFVFMPATAGVGIHTITYTFTDGNGCTGSASDDIEVLASPNVTFTALADLCVNTGIQMSLGGGAPASGIASSTYSGSGVTDNGDGTYDFDPAAAGVGTHTITYSVTATNGCMGAASDDVEVLEAPEPFIEIGGTFCQDDSPLTLEPAVGPSGGVFSGPGVTDDGNGMTFTFDPGAAGVGMITVTYTVTFANGCSGSITGTLTVNGVPNVSFTALSDLCIDAGVQISLGGGSPASSVATSTLYSGPGVTDNGDGTYDFDPAAAGVGVQTLMYTATTNGCSSTASDDVEVFALPTVTFTALPDLCIGDGVQMSIGGGMPASSTMTTGIYSGPGVTNNGDGTYDFDPVAAGIGTHIITYDFTDANGCSGSAMDDVEVADGPSATLSTALYYCLDAPIQSVPIVGGSPSGGVYSGPGVTDNGNGTNYFLDPTVGGPGTITISYTVSGANGCTSVATSTIDIIDCGVSITDPCVCLNNASTIDVDAGTGGDDGQFAEIISIVDDQGGMLPSGQIWTVTAATGAFDANNVPAVGMQSAGVPIATDGSLTLTFNAVLGTYELPFVHVDATGYSITVEGPFGQGSPVNSSLTIGNTCQYPNPEFNPTLPDVICSSDMPITLGATDSNGNGADAISFFINGTPASVF
ncbi:MAG: hypothetical protein AAFP19_12290, partial [Bacteroidota bacterium]